MMQVSPPELGHWYRDAYTGALIEVTLINERLGAIEVQSMDGQHEWLDLAAWRECIIPPEPETPWQDEELIEPAPYMAFRQMQGPESETRH